MIRAIRFGERPSAESLESAEAARPRLITPKHFSRRGRSRFPGLVRVTFAEPVELDGLPTGWPVTVEAVTYPTLDGAGRFEQQTWSRHPDRTTVDEEVRRGAEHIAAVQAAGRPHYTMMSLARRNPELSREAFGDAWRAEAGKLGGEPIPDDVRGLAYVQLHPAGDDDPLYDAINEVWFDDLESLRRRAEWFASRPVPSALFDPGSAVSLYLRVVTLYTAET